jgi:ribose-phosphate pyrophosphokinase
VTAARAAHDRPPSGVAAGSPVVLALQGNEARARDLAARLGAELGSITMRRFPDDETYVRLDVAVTGRPVVLVCTLDRPDTKTIPLLLLAAAARDLGADRVGLVAPYLAYLRQDVRFQPGEGVTSTYFAALLSGAFDWLVTVDPHLHRHRSLAALYTIPTVTVHAAPAIGRWILANVEHALVIGPDVESAQWVEAVAAEAHLPWLVLEKTRRGDRDVAVSVPDMARFKDRTPVLVDDIVSSAQTMIAAVDHLRRAVSAPPVCVGVHAVFAAGAFEKLLASGTARVVTCNTVGHASNAIDVGELLAPGVAQALGEAGKDSHG